LLNPFNPLYEEDRFTLFKEQVVCVYITASGHLDYFFGFALIIGNKNPLEQRQRSEVKLAREILRK
jgi:hypothetical protein